VQVWNIAYVVVTSHFQTVPISVEAPIINRALCDQFSDSARELQSFHATADRYSSYSHCNCRDLYLVNKVI
jgi:hypothetical protein